MATHFSILAWRIHGQRRLVGYSPKGCKESDTTEKRSSEVLKGDFPGSTVVKNQPSMQGTQV